MNLPLRLDELYGHSSGLSCSDGAPENSGKISQFKTRQSILAFFFFNKVKDFHLFKSHQLEREAKTKHKPKRIPQQSAMLCSSYFVFPQALLKV